MSTTSQGEQRAAATSSDTRWPALLARDPEADGTFVFAVLTTGVFCRPSCAARHPRPENVLFFATAVQAQGAGFRACKRCHPADLSPTAATTAAMVELCRLLETSDPCPSLHALAQHAGLSPSHLHRTFKAVVGLTPMPTPPPTGQAASVPRSQQASPSPTPSTTPASTPPVASTRAQTRSSA